MAAALAPSSCAPAWPFAGAGSSSSRSELAHWLLDLSAAMGARFPLAVAATPDSRSVPSGARRYDRLSGPSPLFSSYDVVPLQLEAPFKDLFAQARPNEEYAVTGKLSYTHGGRGVAVDGVKVERAGQHQPARERNAPSRSSRCSCPPTLRRGHFSPASRRSRSARTAGNPPRTRSRQNMDACPTSGLLCEKRLCTACWRRLACRHSRHGRRESRTCDADARPGQSPAQEQSIVRNAVLLEDTDEAVKRFGGVREIEEKAFTNARAQFSAADTARTAFAEAMIGNFDWCLKMTADDAYRCNARHRSGTSSPPRQPTGKRAR